MHDSRRAAKTRAQDGNVLFYILIAVALLAALSFAVAQSNRGNIGHVNEERAKLMAQDMIDYGNAVAGAVAQLRLRGCKETELSFQNSLTGARFTNAGAPSDRTCHIFDKAGGGLVPREFDFPGGLKRQPDFQTGTQAIREIGQDARPDIWMRIMIDNQASSHLICAMLNQMVDMSVQNNTSTAAFEPLEDGSWTDTDFEGSFPAAVATNRPNLNGRPAWCAGHNVDIVSFYRLLLSR